MADTIKVTGAEMSDLVGKFNTQASNFADAVAATTQAVTNLGNWWTGDAYTKFAADWKKTCDAATAQVETLKDTAVAIDTAATQYEETDQKIAKTV